MKARGIWQRFASLRKLGAVFQINIRHQLAYIHDFLVRTIFLAIILFIFANLWDVTYRVQGERLIEGYSLERLMWYLVITESIVMGFPAVEDRIEQEVKNGEIAYYLIRPIHYIGYHYGIYLSEALIRILVNLGIGGTLIYFLYGGISASPTVLFGFFLLVLLAVSLQFASVMIVCLGAFWVEDIRGFHLVYSRLVMILGGMMVPLEIFPEWLQRIAENLPFQAMVYLPASYFVRGQQQGFGELALVQGLWLAALWFLLWIVFRQGVKKLNVNGG